MTDDPLVAELDQLKELRAMRSPEAEPATDDFLTQLVRAYLYNRNRAAALTLRLDRLERALLDGGAVTLAQLNSTATFAPNETPTKADR